MKISKRIDQPPKGRHFAVLAWSATRPTAIAILSDLYALVFALLCSLLFYLFTVLVKSLGLDPEMVHVLEMVHRSGTVALFVVMNLLLIHKIISLHFKGGGNDPAE